MNENKKNRLAKLVRKIKRIQEDLSEHRNEDKKLAENVMKRFKEGHKKP